MKIDSRLEIGYMYDYLDKQGYKFNEYNPFGIRNIDKLNQGIFNDSIGLLCKDFIYLVRGTTDPSPYYIEERPMNANGTAVMCSGLQDRIWMVGLHAKKFTGLINGWRGGFGTKKQSVKRLDKNYKYKNKIYKGWFCCNLHPTFNVSPEKIGRNSAGCQVIRVESDFNLYMSHILTSKEYVGNKKTLYSYYMFEQNKAISDIIGKL